MHSLLLWWTVNCFHGTYWPYTVGIVFALLGTESFCWVGMSECVQTGWFNNHSLRWQNSMPHQNALSQVSTVCSHEQFRAGQRYCSKGVSTQNGMKFQRWNYYLVLLLKCSIVSIFIHKCIDINTYFSFRSGVLDVIRSACELVIEFSEKNQKQVLRLLRQRPPKRLIYTSKPSIQIKKILKNS